MTKIEKQDIDNIKLVVKETKLKNISKIRIKKIIMKLKLLQKILFLVSQIHRV